MVCKCGKEFIYAKTPTGKNMPVDINSQVVRVTLGADNNFVAEYLNKDINQGPVYGVNHFHTCKFANDFSKGKHRQDLEIRVHVSPTRVGQESSEDREDLRRKLASLQAEVNDMLAGNKPREDQKVQELKRLTQKMKDMNMGKDS